MEEAVAVVDVEAEERVELAEEVEEAVAPVVVEVVEDAGVVNINHRYAPTPQNTATHMEHADMPVGIAAIQKIIINGTQLLTTKWVVPHIIVTIDS